MLQLLPSKRASVRSLLRQLLSGFCISILAVSGTAVAAVSQTPLFLVIPAKPNIMYTLDNSGSMSWGDLTGNDGLTNYDKASMFYSTTRAFYSSAYNLIYYNPATTYTPGVNYKGVSLGNSTPSSAINDPYTAPTGGTLDLTTICYVAPASPVAPRQCNSYTATTKYTQKVARYAYYYKWDGTTTIFTTVGPVSYSNPETTNDAAFPSRVDILPGNTYSKATTRTDCAANFCTYAEEIQNFANWYSYYSTRIKMQKSVMSQVYAILDPVQTIPYTPQYRVGFNTINPIDNAGNVGYNNTDVTDGADWLTIRDFDETQKQKFYNTLFAIQPNQGTPLRTQMDRIGKLFEGTLSGFDYTNDDPYRTSTTDATLLSCRSSYHILSTDGYWNESNTAAGFPTVGNTDGVDSGFSTRAIGAYDALGSSNSLADVALYYYMTDLRPSLPDNLPGSPTDPAKWQHVQTFTIGLGANGTLKYQSNYATATTGDFADIKAGKKDWPIPVANDPTAVDDLWHAAVNGRGQYFSAGDPTTLTSGLTTILKQIANQTGAAASVATTGSYVGGATSIYAPGFESAKWTGHLVSYGINPATGVQGAKNWDAADLLPVWNTRNIVTWNPTSKAAVTFDWANLTSGVGSQQSALGNSDVLDYLKGNGAKEQTAAGQGPGIYRYREKKLGDIVNSAPQFAQDEDFGYATVPTVGATYAAYLTSKSSNTPMLYAGANDGMLHAFNANTGVETFAYIPNSVYGNLKSLSDPTYVHQYFVDGPLTVGDYHNGTSWKTVLVGSTGAGMTSSIFALDITTPGSLGTGSVMWEKTAADIGLADLGKVMGKMVIGRLPSGDSVIMLGNGYDSATGKAALFLIKMADGSVLKEFDLGGTVAAPNALSAPAPLFNRNHELIGAYAGDVNGNLWKFGFVDPPPASQTTLSYQNPVTLFITNKDATNTKNIQPIAQKPHIQVHPKGGYLVSFGTGKFVENADKTSTDIQSIYGIWDKPGAGAAGHANLVQQTLTAATGGRTLTTNTIDWASKRGWYIDLLTSGERVVGDLLFRDSTILLETTFVPTSDSCQGGGTSQIMGFYGLTGAASSTPLFYKNDGVTPYSNLSSVAISGTQANPVAIKLTSGTTVLKFNNLDGSQGQIMYRSSVPPFRTWREIIFKN
ncbi:hypothetical protein LPB67_17880 [Undibacterium sp. Jales W-56]|uniref:pilus assembly protein n=1 Tax=Undibacterium sp. Jales W-56 TaxID=2897325 RepID=UPI0021CFF9A8|nr:PilC/PilY family type IV pilus protein [Undibacterium sp. Jales W-56]MCU6435650.1 hypothetical protein [Undibacterium sp. Jales W-56]